MKKKYVAICIAAAMLVGLCGCAAPGKNNSAAASTPTGETTPDAGTTPAGDVGQNTDAPTTPLPTEAEHHDPVPARHVENLQAELDKADLPKGTVAKVTTIDGQEYLQIGFEDYTFYYRNDYVKYGAEPYGKVIMEKNALKREFSWDYSLKADNIGRLVPVVFDWVENKREQMAFVFQKMGDSSEECTGVHFVSCLDLLEYYTASPELGFLNSLSIDGFVETDTETMVCLVNDARKYYIPAGRKLSEAEKKNVSLSVINDVKYSLLHERVYVSSKVELTGIGWVGEFSSRVQASYMDTFSNFTNVFYCYADQIITEKDNMVIVAPVKKYEDTKRPRVQVTGDKGEKMVLFAKEGTTLSWQDPSLMVKDENEYMHYNDPGVETVWGVDVSKYNTVNSWKKVKDAGFDFAIVRMGYRGYGTAGSLQTDGAFKSHIEGALNAGLDVGVYYFTQAITVQEAIEEADTVIAAIRQYNVKYPVIFDTEFYSLANPEDSRANYMSMQERTDIIKAFCDRVKQAGYTPMIYSSTNWSLLNYDRSQLDEYDFWYAYYGLNVDYPYHYEMLQYASDGKVPGISGDVDINICFKKY